MRIATLQFSPKVGEIAANFSRAESLLMRDEREGLLKDLDLLVLPEMAFTGKFLSVSRSNSHLWAFLGNGVKFHRRHEAE